VPSEILINVRPWETRVACVENGLLSDLVIERKSNPTIVGSVYRGRVIRVLPGMQAAFIDIGLDRAGFLYVRDILPYWDEEQDEPFSYDSPDPLKSDHLKAEHLKSEHLKIEIETSDKPLIQDLIREGQHILVQVAKDPLGTKGARLTMNLSFPGRFVVYMPTVKHIGISRKIESLEERERLKNVVGELLPEGCGVIIRTAGEGAAKDDLCLDIEYLSRMSQEIQKAFEKKKGVGLLHQEPELELRVLRDILSAEVSAVWVDSQEMQKKLIKFVSQLMPKYKHNVVFYDDKKPLFDKYDLDIEISRSMERKIWLKSGGYIVVDEAEALVVIDVNTGRFVGKKDLDETILKTNLEAAREIAYQLRIRNIGGIIIVDFIDMEKENHREKVVQVLTEEVKKDRARTQVMSMSSLGLVEMTRKRTRPSLNKNLTESCSYCEGKGYIKRRSTIGTEIFRKMEREYSSYPSAKKSIEVRCHAQVVDWIYEVASEMLSELEVRLGRSIHFHIEAQFHVEQYEIKEVFSKNSSSESSK
jgi:ribonuclease G